jgi:hypothetical protein
MNLLIISKKILGLQPFLQTMNRRQLSAVLPAAHSYPVALPKPGVRHCAGGMGLWP